MALRATKDDENLAKAHFPRQYIDAAPRRQVAGGWCEVFDRAPHSFGIQLAMAQNRRGARRNKWIVVHGVL